MNTQYFSPINSKEATTADLVIILGGPIGVYDQEEFPFLHDEIRFIKRRLDAKRPTLGICLGAQLMANALGAKVYPGLAKEIGWTPLTLTEAGKNSPLRHLAGSQTSMFHWHGDTFDLPPQVSLLASTEEYAHQAFAVGNYGLALQFHPEVTAEDMERWLIGHAIEIDHTPNLSVNQLRAETQNNIHQLQNQAGRFWHDWLQSLDK